MFPTLIAPHIVTEAEMEVAEQDEAKWEELLGYQRLSELAGLLRQVWEFLDRSSNQYEIVSMAQVVDKTARNWLEDAGEHFYALYGSDDESE